MSKELDDFIAEVTPQLGGLTSAEYVAAHPGEHIWGMFRGVVSCAFCGMCRVRDQSKQGPCRGIVRVTLRGSDD